jgi:ribonuclease HI
MRQAYAHRQRIQVTWIKGHAGHPLNAAADQLASLAVEEGRGVPPSQITATVEDIAGVGLTDDELREQIASGVR